MKPSAVFLVLLFFIPHLSAQQAITDTQHRNVLRLFKKGGSVYDQILIKKAELLIKKIQSFKKKIKPYLFEVHFRYGKIHNLLQQFYQKHYTAESEKNFVNLYENGFRLIANNVELEKLYYEFHFSPRLMTDVFDVLGSDPGTCIEKIKKMKNFRGYLIYDAQLDFVRYLQLLIGCIENYHPNLYRLDGSGFPKEKLSLAKEKSRLYLQVLIDYYQALAVHLSIPHNYPQLSQEDRSSACEIFINLVEILRSFQSLVNEAHEIYKFMKELKAMTTNIKRGQFLLKYYQEHSGKSS